MKKKYLIAVIFVLAATLASYGFYQFGFQGEDEEQIAIAKAQALTAQVIDQAYRAYFTGDLFEFKKFLAKKDPDGIVRSLLKKNGIDINAPRVRIMTGVGLPPFKGKNSPFKDGDIILSGTKGSIIGWVLPGEYTHCGVLNEELYAGPDSGCVLTANLDGVTYETYTDWNSGSPAEKIVTLLRSVKPISRWLMNWAQNSIWRWYHDWTIYAFLKLNLDPVSRWDPLRWYCSKTVWRVYKKVGKNVENADYYFDGEFPDWQNVMENSGLFQLYVALLVKLGIDEDTAIEMATEKLMNASDECITPDEIRYDNDLGEIASWGTPIMFSLYH